MFASSISGDNSGLIGCDDSRSSAASPDEEMGETPVSLVPPTLFPWFTIDPVNKVDYVPPTPQSIDEIAAADSKMSAKRRTMRGTRRTRSPRPIEVEHPPPNRFAGPVGSSRPDNRQKTSLKSASSPRTAKVSAPCSTVRLAEDTGDGHAVRATHNEIEKKYRCRLNSSFLRLLAAVDSSDSGDASLYGDSDVDNKGSRNLSKAAVLDLASQRLLALKHQNERLRNELVRLNIALGMRCT